jgi:hypothetical protein
MPHSGPQITNHLFLSAQKSLHFPEFYRDGLFRMGSFSSDFFQKLPLRFIYTIECINGSFLSTTEDYSTTQIHHNFFIQTLAWQIFKVFLVSSLGATTDITNEDVWSLWDRGTPSSGGQVTFL